jgi:hypothetical protein
MMTVKGSRDISLLHARNRILVMELYERGSAPMVSYPLLPILKQVSLSRASTYFHYCYGLTNKNNINRLNDCLSFKRVKIYFSFYFVMRGWRYS